MNDIEKHENIINAIAKKTESISVGVVREYFNRINAPIDLRYIDHVVNEMKKITSVLNDVAEDKDKVNLNDWRNINLAVLQSSNILDAHDIKLLGDRSGGEINNSSLHGIKQSNSLYCVLWYMEEISAYPKQYLMMKSIMFRVFINLEKHSNSDYCYDCSLLFRKFGNEQYKDILSLLPDKPQSVASYMCSLIEIKRANKVKDIDMVSELLRCILIAEDKETYESRHRSGGGSGGDGGGKGPGGFPSRQSLEYVDSIIDDSDPEFEQCNVFHLKDFKDEDPENKINDYINKSEVLELIPRADDYLDIDPKLEAIKHAGIRNAMAMHSHFLPSHRSQLSLWEVGHVFKYINDEFNSEYNDIEILEKLIMLSLMLMFGRSLKELSSIKIIKSVDSRLVGCSIGYIESTCSLKLLISSPEYKTKLSDEQKTHAVNVDNEIILPIPEIVSDAINNLIKIKKDRKTLHKRKLFYWDEDHYKKDIIKTLRKITKSNTTEVSLRKYVFQTLYSESGDLSYSIMLTNQRYGVPGSRLHYTTIPKSRIISIYKNAFNNLLSDVVDEFSISLNSKKMWLINESYSCSGHVGARITPKVSVVQDLIKGLKSKLKKGKDLNWIDYHNTFTTYCILMLDFATGTRSVKRKYFFESDIDLLNKRVLVWDKNSGDSLNSRVVYIPSICVDQINEYIKYRGYVVDKISGVVDSKYEKLLPDNNQKPSSYSKSNLRSHVENNFGQFFFLTEYGEPEIISRKLLQGEVEGLFFLPLNANRHYIRYNLLDCLVDGEVIDAYLGHSSFGEESFGRFSYLTLNEVISSVKSVINMMFIRDGWSVIKGVTYG
ncbi:MAG: hypothetical protein QM484_07225 [Woeseiaceae bacterium]